jgi:hypothetical protein
MKAFMIAILCFIALLCVIGVLSLGLTFFFRLAPLGIVLSVYGGLFLFIFLKIYSWIKSEFKKEENQ